MALSPVDSHVLPLLDGTRDRDALEDALLALAREGQIPFKRDGQPVSGESELREAVVAYIDALPQRLTEMKLVSARQAGL